MNVPTLNVTQEAARQALLQYKAHRNVYDKRDWEIERIYRQISRGKTVISAFDAIRAGGLDEYGRPKLALMRADQQACRADVYYSDKIVITNEHRSKAAEWHFEIPWPDRPPRSNGARGWTHVARLPRIPPQYRPTKGILSQYHLLWEAEWAAVPPRDPYLLKRIGKDAWVVLAAWDLSDVEISVLRAHQEAR